MSETLLIILLVCVCDWTCSDVVECELTFAGLIVMQNRLKPETSPVIQTLIKANIRPVMITGERERVERKKEGEEKREREGKRRGRGRRRGGERGRRRDRSVRKGIVHDYN